MKVLFAVSNDNITTSVVKKYQQKYKEIITNKNVYYFNAIVKELQRDKSYDCIVIEEDLEPISNNNYDAIDRFLTEKLDSISDEAGKPTGEDIPIIFICADRRTVSDKLLIKLFSMGIYNALVGNDRSLDKLCELIAKPRNKKDAKKYYKIDTDKVEYQSQKDEIVSEDQIQNIINYYKRIGANERKCVQAFDSISKQYDSTQLRIIVKFLPMDVKAILEARSPVYQRLMSNGTVLSNGQYSAYHPNNPKKPEKLGFVSKDLNTNSAKPRSVVIPTNMKVQESEPIKEDDTGLKSSQNGNLQSNTNQQFGQYGQNAYRNGQYNPYNSMGQSPYGNMYGRMQKTNPYGMGNTMGQQNMYNNGMQYSQGMSNYQTNYNANMNNNSNTTNSFGQNTNTNSNGSTNNPYGQNTNTSSNESTTNTFGLNTNTSSNESTTNPFAQNINTSSNESTTNTFGQNTNTSSNESTTNPFSQNINTSSNESTTNTFGQSTNTSSNESTNNPFGQNINTNSNESTINPFEQITSLNNDNNGASSFEQITNNNNNLQQNNSNVISNSSDMQENTMKTQQADLVTVTDNQLLPQEENKSLLKQENDININGIKDSGNLTTQPVLSEEKATNDSSNSEVEQETVEPVKRRRGRPRKIRKIEEEGNIPTVKRRRGRPRKVELEDKNDAQDIKKEESINETTLMPQQQSAIQQNQQPLMSQESNQTELNSQNVEAKVEQQINESRENSTLPFKTQSFNNITESTLNNDVSLNDLKTKPEFVNNSINNISNNNNIETNEQQLYRKPNEIKPINLYDLDIDSEDMFADNSNSNLGIKPIDEIKLAEDNDTPISKIKQNDISNINTYMNENADLIEQQRKNDNLDLRSPIAGNGKIVAFVGTSKNGTSFLVNNIALLLSQTGINTAIVDLTKNKNSYYMFTDNDSGKTKIATESLKLLSEGVVDGLKVNNDLTVFTALPENYLENNINHRTVLESLASRFEVVLLDCDFKTHEAYFALANEIFLTQSMDAFTIQPLTKFLSDLKLKNILDEKKLRIVINKYIKLKKLDYKMIVGGMSKYNEPSMTLQRDLFDPKKIRTITIPFDLQTYTKYLESIAMCQVSINGYSREVVEGLEKVKNLVYPLVAGNGRVNRNNNYTNYNNNMNYNNQRNSQGFSNNMNDTLNKMRSNNF